jgi:aspartokinase-like uncharacterized kinase
MPECDATVDDSPTSVSARPHGGPVVVLKVGGSLLSLPDLGDRLARLLEQLADCRPVLLCGGGDLVDVIRGWHNLHQLAEAASHALAMRALDVTAMLLARLLPAARLCKCVEDIESTWRRAELPILVPEAWLRCQSRGMSPAIPWRPC